MLNPPQSPALFLQGRQANIYSECHGSCQTCGRFHKGRSCKRCLAATFSFSGICHNRTYFKIHKNEGDFLRLHYVPKKFIAKNDLVIIFVRMFIEFKAHRIMTSRILSQQMLMRTWSPGHASSRDLNQTFAFFSSLEFISSQSHARYVESRNTYYNERGCLWRSRGYSSCK